MQEKIYAFNMSTKIISGKNIVENAAEYIRELKGKSVMIVTDQGIVKAGLLKKLEKLVEDSMKSGNVLLNPRKNTNDDIRKLFKDAYCGNL